MCYQLIEHYNDCGCIYHIHAVDPCPRAKQRGHAIAKTSIAVGYACSRHSLRAPTELIASQRNNVIKPAQYVVPDEPEHLRRREARPSGNGSITLGHIDHRSLQTEIVAYATRETSINRTLETIVAPSARGHAGHVEDGSPAPSCSASIFDGVSASSNSSVEREPEFAEELLSAFVSNVTLVPLFRLALKRNPRQFAKVFTALLRLYSKDLAQVSSSPLENNASLVVRARSRYIASHLKDYFIGCNPGGTFSQPMMQQVGLRGQDVEDEDKHDAFEVPHLFSLKLDQVKGFLFDGVPFLKLRQRLAQLVREASNSGNIASSDPIPSTSKYHDNPTPKRIDNLEAVRSSALQSREIEMTSSRTIFAEQETVVTKQTGKQTEGGDTVVITAGNSPLPPDPKTELPPNDVRGGGSNSYVVRLKPEETLSASQFFINTDADSDHTIVSTTNPHETASSTFIRTVILLVLIKRLRRRHAATRTELRDTSSTTSEWSSTLERSLTSFSTDDRFPENLQQSGWSQVAENDPMGKNKGYLCNESSPLLGRDWRVQEVSWVCSCGKVVFEHLEQLSPGGVTQFLDDVDTSFGRSFKDPGENACFSSRHRRNKIFVLFGRILNSWDHSGHNFITGTASSNASTGESVSSDSSVERPGRSGIERRSAGLQQHINCSCVSCVSSQDSSTAGSSGSCTTAASFAWIHTCIETYPGRIRLKAVDLRGFQTDGPMFTKINEAYFGTSFWRPIRRIFTLRTLTSVELVHFNVDRHNNVAIDTADHRKLPPPNEYLYIPCPPAIAGLIPREFLYFCVTNPSSTYGHVHIWRDRMPKYTGEELRCQPDEPFTPGYGLYFRESLSWIKIWIIMAMFTISSFTFSGLWIRYHEGAIQDAFTMGGSILTVATIGLGLVHGLDAFWGDRLRGKD